MEKLQVGDKLVCLDTGESPFLEKGYTYKVNKINQEDKLGQDVLLRKNGEVNKIVGLFIKLGSKKWAKI